MRISLVSILAVWCCLLLTPTESSGQSCVATVYFGNGILTDQELAKTTRDKLRTEVNKALVSEGRDELPPYCFDYMYASKKDSNVAFLTELTESVFQKAGNLLGPFWQWLGGGIDPSNKFESIIQDLFVGFGNVSYVFNSDLQDHVIKYRNALAGGTKLVIVAHSQGNLFANEAFAVLTKGADGQPSVPGSRISIVAVATPDHFVAGGGPHTTLYGDAILAVPLRLPANTAVDGTPCIPIITNPQLPGLTPTPCHSFIKSYLEGAVSKPRIIAGVLGAVPFVDDFNDSSINASFWNAVIVPGGAGTISETNGRLQMLKTASGSQYLGLQSKCKVRGDFDLQVDFGLLNWPPMSFHTVRLSADSLPQGPLGVVGVYRNSFNSENYQLRTASGIVANVDRSDLSGKLRLKRVGSTISGYYWNGASFLLLGSSPTTLDDTRFVIDFAGASGAPIAPPAGVAVAFDNFTVSSGSLVCAP